MSFKLPLVLSIVAAVFKDRSDLVAENIALRQQLSCFVHRGPRAIPWASWSRRQRSRFEKIAGDAMIRFGYALDWD